MTSLLENYEGFAASPKGDKDPGEEVTKPSPTTTTDEGFIQVAQAKPTPSLEKPTVDDDDDTIKDVVPPVAEPPVEVPPEVAAPAAEPTAAVPAAIEPPVKVPEEVTPEEGVAPVVGLDVERDAEPDVIPESKSDILDRLIRRDDEAPERRTGDVPGSWRTEGKKQVFGGTPRNKWNNLLDDTRYMDKVLKGINIPEKGRPAIMELLAEKRDIILDIFESLGTKDPDKDKLGSIDKTIFTLFARVPYELIELYQSEKQVIAKTLTIGSVFVADMLVQSLFYLGAMGGEAVRPTYERIKNKIMEDPKKVEVEVTGYYAAAEEIANTPPGFFEQVGKFYTIFDEDGKVIKKEGTATEKVMSFKKNFGIDENVAEFRDWLTDGIYITEEDRDFVDRAFGYATEFAIPLFGLPTMGYIRLSRRLLRGFDDINIKLHIGREVRALGKSKSESENIISQLRLQAEQGKLGKIRADEQHFYLPAPQSRFSKEIIPPYTYKVDRTTAARAYDVYGRIGKLSAAGIYGASSEEVLKRMLGEDYHHYRFVPYLFAMGGYIAGGRNTLRMLSRTPFAATGVYAGVSGAGLFPSAALNVVGPGYAIAQSAGILYAGGGWALKLLRGISEEGGKFNAAMARRLDAYLESDYGKFLVYQAGGGDLGKGLKALNEMRKRKKDLRKKWEQGEYKNYPNFNEYSERMKAMEKNPFDNLLADVEFDPEVVKLIKRAGATWTKMDAKRNLKSIEDFIKLNAELTFKGGVDFANNHMTLISQFLGSAQIKSLQKVVLGSHRFDQGIFRKEGPLSSLKGLFNLDKASAVALIDEYHILMNHQNQAIAHTMYTMRKNEDVGEQTQRLISFMENKVAENESYIVKLIGLRTLVKERFTEIEDKAAIDELNHSVNKSLTDGGFTLPQYSPKIEGLSKLPTQQHIEMITERGSRFVGDATNLLKNVTSTIYKESTEVYNKIDRSTPVNATPIVEKLTEIAFPDSRVVEYLFGPPIPGVTNTTMFIAYTRQNFIKEASSRVRNDYAKIVATEIWDKFQKEGWNLIFKRSTIEGDKSIDNFFKKIIKKLEKDPQSPSALKNLTVIRGMNDEAVAYLDEIMPSILPLGKATEIRTILWNNVERLTGVESHNARNLAEEVDKVFNSSIENSAEILGDLKFDKNAVAETIGQLIKANALYKSSIGEVIKTYHGQRMVVSQRKQSEMGSPPTIVNKISDFLLDHERMYQPEQFKGAADVFPEPYGIMMFRRMFPPDGADIDIMAKNPDTMKMEAVGSVPRQEAREQMIKFFAHSIGLRLRNKDTEWLETMPFTDVKGTIVVPHLRQLEKEGLLNNKQVAVLSRYKLALKQQESADMSPALTLLHRSVTDNVSRIIALENRKHGQSILDELVGGSKFEISTFVKILFDADFARSLRELVGEETRLGGEVLKDMEKAKHIYRVRFGREPPKEVNELRQELENILQNQKGEIFEKPLEILFDAVKKSPRSIDGLEDIIYYHIAKESFKSTNEVVRGKALKIIGGKGNIENNSTNALEGGASVVGAGGDLVQTLDLSKMNDLVTRAIPMLKRIIEFRESHHLPGTKDRRKALKSLMNIMAWAKITKGETPGMGRLLDVPSGLGKKQVVGRIYNVARGFVHPGYVAAEYSFLRVGTRRAQLLATILTDPHAMKVFEEAIIHGREPRKQGLMAIKEVTARALRGMALTEDEKENTILDKPVTWTRKLYEKAHWDLFNRPSPLVEGRMKKAVAIGRAEKKRKELLESELTSMEALKRALSGNRPRKKLQHQYSP